MVFNCENEYTALPEASGQAYPDYGDINTLGDSVEARFSLTLSIEKHVPIRFLHLLYDLDNIL